MEDFAQEFKTALNHLDLLGRPTVEMTIWYFIQGLQTALRNAVASYDIAGCFDGLIALAICVKKRMGHVGAASDSNSKIDLDNDAIETKLSTKTRMPSNSKNNFKLVNWI